MAAPQKVYVDDNGMPVPPKVRVDDTGRPLAAASASAAAPPPPRAVGAVLADLTPAMRAFDQMAPGPDRDALLARMAPLLTEYQQAREAPPPPPPGPETDAHGNRIVRNPDGSIKFLQGPGFRGNADLSPDRNVLDVGGIGIAPEAVLGGVQAGRAVLAPGLKLAGRAGATLEQATPLAKFYVTKKLLESFGVPSDLADLAAYGISGFKRGAKAAPAEGPGAVSTRGYPQGSTTAPAAPVRSAPVSGEPVAVPPAGPGPNAITPQLGTPVGRVTAAPPVTPLAAPVRDINAVPAAAASAPPAAPVRAAAGAFNPATALAEVKQTFAALGETPLRAEASNAMEYLRRGESAEDAVAHVLRLRPSSVRSAPVPAASVPAASAVAAAKPVWTAEEVVLGQRLMARGLTQQEAMDAILAQRTLLQVPGTQSSAEVRAAQDLRHARGATKTPSAATAATRRR